MYFISGQRMKWMIAIVAVMIAILGGWLGYKAWGPAVSESTGWHTANEEMRQLLQKQSEEKEKNRGTAQADEKSPDVTKKPSADKTVSGAATEVASKPSTPKKDVTADNQLTKPSTDATADGQTTSKPDTDAKGAAIGADDQLDRAQTNERDTASENQPNPSSATAADGVLAAGAQDSLPVDTSTTEDATSAQGSSSSSKPARPIASVGSADRSTTTPTKEKEKGKIKLNKATAAQLITIPGIGESKAKAILEHRKQIGHFKSIEQLLDVKGIGDKLLERMMPYLVIES